MKTWILLWSLLLSSAMAGQVLVFLPGGKKAAIKKEISKYSSGEVKVFTSANKFLRAVKKDPNAAVVAPGPAVAFNKSLKTLFKGKKGASEGETWYVIAANPDVNAGNLASKKIGLWDIMGRKNIKKFFKNYFGVKVGKTKRVNKFKDLQPLLGMDMVDALALSESDYNKLKKNTSVKLNVVLKSTKKIPFAQVAVPASGTASDVDKLQKAPKSFLKTYGFEAWRAK